MAARTAQQKKMRRAFHKCKPILGYKLIGKKMPHQVYMKVGTNSYGSCLRNELIGRKRRRR